MKKLIASVLFGGLWLHGASGPVSECVSAVAVKPVTEDYHKPMNLWKISTAALLASNAVDIKSSWGKRELNPVLSSTAGTLGGKGALLKLGIEGSVVAMEYLVIRHRPSASVIKKLTWINFADTSITTGVAIRNFATPGR